jgi:hypothetical protein
MLMEKISFPQEFIKETKYQPIHQGHHLMALMNNNNKGWYILSERPVK